jgi:hypothetical protein
MTTFREGNRNMPALLILTAMTLLLAGCATPEFNNAKAECSNDAFRQYPVNNIPTVVTLTRPVQVPTGQTNCTTSYMGNFANTSCQQVMRTEYIPYQQTRIVDANARSRDSAIDSCAAGLCIRRYGNAECRTK